MKDFNIDEILYHTKALARVDEEQLSNWSLAHLRRTLKNAPNKGKALSSILRVIMEEPLEEILTTYEYAEVIFNYPDMRAF